MNLFIEKREKKDFIYDRECVKIDSDARGTIYSGNFSCNERTAGVRASTYSFLWCTIWPSMLERIDQMTVELFYFV